MRLGEKPIKIWNFWENLKIYIQKSQWKIDFLPIFSPIFQDFCHFLHLCNIPKFGGSRGNLTPGWEGVLSSLGVGGCINPCFPSNLGINQIWMNERRNGGKVNNDEELKGKNKIQEMGKWTWGAGIKPGSGGYSCNSLSAWEAGWQYQCKFNSWILAATYIECEMKSEKWTY